MRTSYGTIIATLIKKAQALPRYDISANRLDVFPLVFSTEV